MTKVLVFMGVSGSGKSYNARKLSEEYKNGEKFERLIQYTTRKIRDEEQNGYDYFFVSEDDYDEIKKVLTCRTVINGNKYGTSIKDINNDNGKIKIVVLNAEGCEDIIDLKNKKYPDLNIRFVNIISPKVVRREGRDDSHLDNEAKELAELYKKFTVHNIYNYNPESESYLTLDELVEELRDKLGNFIE